MKNVKEIKILVVEDDKTSAKLLSNILEKLNYSQPALIASGEEAIKKARKDKPDIIFMDIGLDGEIDGVCAADAISKHYTVPIIYITGNDDPEIVERAKKTMPYGYVLKPFNSNIIKTTIEMALYKFDAENKIRIVEKRNQDILSAIPDVMFSLTSEGLFVDPVEKDLASRIWPENVSAKAKNYIWETITAGTNHVFEYSLKKKDQIKHYEARMINAENNTVLVIVRDITIRKEAENELRQYKDNLENIVDERTQELTVKNRDLETQIGLREHIENNLKVFSYAINQNPNIIIIINNHSQVEFINEKFKEISGYYDDEVIGVNVAESSNPIVPEPEMWKLMISKEQWKGDIYNINKGGEIYYLRAMISSLKDDNGNIVRYVIIADDITQQKKELMAIEQVRNSLDSSKLSDLDKELDWQEWKDKMMSRNISRTDKSLFRNINNSFTQGAGFGSLISLLEMMKQSATEEGDQYKVDKSLFDLVQQNLGTAQDAFKTFANIDWIITNDFDLSTSSYEEFYDLVKVVIDDVQKYANLKDQHVVISEFSHHYDHIKVNINNEYLSKALYESLLNACKFSRKGSYIVVMIYEAHRNLCFSVVNDPDKNDDGIVGIPAEYEKIVFEPFYRLTKFVFENYKTLDFGLGLTLIEKIITKHGAEVYMENILDHTDLKREPQVKVNLSIFFPFARD